jgi:DHA2 family multidrug resistance protein
MSDSSTPDSSPVVNRWVVAISVMLGTFMVVLDTTVVNVSLPYIAGTLSASIDQATWALTSYLAANAVILPMTGWLANYFGRKRLLLASVAGFSTASCFCGLSPSLGMLIVFRTIQGMTGGLMQPLSQAVMLEAFPPEDRGKAMGFWGLGIVVAPILGPVLGGWLTQNYSWRWVFYINIPIGILAIIMIRLFIFDPAYIRRMSGRIDYWGMGLLAVGIGTLQVALDQGEEKDWFSSPWIKVLFITAAVGLVALVIRELTAKNPIVDLRVFKERTYTAGVVLITLMGFVLFGSLVLIPVMLQSLMGYPALQAGITMAPRGFGSLIAMPVVGLLTTKFDPRKLLAVGFVTTGLTLHWLALLNLEAGYWDLFWPQFCQGLALGFLFVPLTTVTMDPIPNRAMGNATSLFNLTRNLGGSCGIAIVETFLARHLQLHTSILRAHLNAYSDQAQQMLQAVRAGFMAQGDDLLTATNRAYAALSGMIYRQASILSYLDTFERLALISFVVLPLVLLMRRPRTGRRASVAVAE